MKYFGYIIIFAGLIAGYVGFHTAAIIGLAIISTLIHAPARRKGLKSQPQAPDQNMILDGVFLFVSQIIIIFTVYILGYFASTVAGDMFMQFLSGKS